VDFPKIFTFQYMTAPRSRRETKERQKRDKERLREPQEMSLVTSYHTFRKDSASLLSSPSSYVALKIIMQKLQELDFASPPRARLSGYPFSIKHAHHLARLLIGQAGKFNAPFVVSLMIGSLGCRRKQGCRLVSKQECNT